MGDRQPVEIVIRDLKTKADKIRRLANAGYSRVEISKALGIRYQHARNVLVRSGGANGRAGASAEAERSPIRLPLKPTSTLAATSSKTLRRAGFQTVAEWTSAGDSIQLDSPVPREPGVYALTLDDKVVYVGLTLTGLRRRMDQYRRGYKHHRTSSRVKELIMAALVEGRRVKVMVAIPQHSVWNGLPVNTAAGLEAGLIELIRPAWNILGAG